MRHFFSLNLRLRTMTVTMRSPRGSSSTTTTTTACSSPSLSVRNWWNRILLLLLVTAVLNLTWMYQHDDGDHDQHHPNRQTPLLMHSIKNEFRVFYHGNNKTGKHSAPADQPQEAQQIGDGGGHRVAGLSCQQYGGPPDELAAEMVYWSDIPSDASFVSPLQKAGPKVKYLTFEPDKGGFNNIRMAMETVVAMAIFMGRTIVLPPQQGMYLLGRNEGGQKATFTFADFFHFDSVATEHLGVNVISFDEFLKREAMTGNMRNRQTGQVSYPPNNRTFWFGRADVKHVFAWMRTVSATPIWGYDDCVVAFPAQPGQEGDQFLQRMNDTLTSIFMTDKSLQERIDGYVGNPTPVDAPPEQRLRELVSYRKHLCMYDAAMQQEKVVHMMTDLSVNARLLVHFYAFLLFEDWRHDLWTKRFIRDHLRYVDEIQCAAARVVQALREKSRANGHGGAFEALHIRRGDFQYKDTRLEPHLLYKYSRDVLVPNATIYIATDERNSSFFDIFREHYDVYFLDDFEHLLKDVNSNLHGMIDQRICSRARTFVGTFYSSFTGYINRMRGYHSQKDKAEGYEKGRIQSYYFFPEQRQRIMQDYVPVFNPLWGLEFPVGWRNLDRGVDQIIPATIKKG